MRIELDGVGFAQGDEVLAIAAIDVAARQIVVDLGEIDALFQIVLVGMGPQSVFVQGQRFAPTPLRFEFFPLLKQIVQFGGRDRLDDLDRDLGRSQLRKRGGEEAAARARWPNGRP